MKKVLMNIQQAPYHVIMLAHVIETEMEDSSKRLVPQVGTVPFSKSVGKYFDHMVYCHMMNKSHRFGSSTTYSMQAVTGSRTDIKVEDLKDKPSLKDLFQFSPEKANHDSVAASASLLETKEKTAATIEKAPVSTSDKVASLLAGLKK